MWKTPVKRRSKKFPWDDRIHGQPYPKPRHSDSTTEEIDKKKGREIQMGKNEEAAFEKLKTAVANSTTNMYFDPNKKTMLRTEASYNEGISAGLFQMTPQGMKPVLFISKSLTETEKRYSQTEKDALAIRWAAKRLRIYLIGSPRFKLTSHYYPCSTKQVRKSLQELRNG